MPQVEVYYGPAIAERVLDALRTKLPRMVVDALSTEDARFSEADVEVRFREADKLDVRHYDLEITVSVNDSPDRAAELLDKECIHRIYNPVGQFVPDQLSYSVQISLRRTKSAHRQTATPSEVDLFRFFNAHAGLTVGLLMRDDRYLVGKVTAAAPEIVRIAVIEAGQVSKSESIPFSEIRQAIYPV